MYIVFMEKTDFKKLSPEAQYEVRKAAVRMANTEKTQEETAAFFGVTRRTITNWVKAYRKEGAKGLRSEKRGRKEGEQRTITRDQEREIQKLIIDKCPEQLKLPFALWSRKAVKELIMDRFGITMPIRTVGEYLKRWGFTPQKPLKRAYEQRPEHVQQWLEKEYPVIKQRAKAENAAIYWGDETGVSSEDHRGRGYSLKGQTPIRYKTGSRFSISMISAIANQGQMRYMIYKGALQVKTFITFLRRLIKDATKKVFLIVDNLRVHHAKIVRKWLKKHADRIELFFLPPYTPERNPDEYLNNSVKTSLQNQQQPKDCSQMTGNLRRHMKSLQKNSQKIISFFKHQSVAYAA